METALHSLRLSPKLIAFWFVLSIGLGAIGPFGSYDLLDFPARLAYWTGVVSFSLGLEIANQKFVPIRNFIQRVLRRFFYILIVGLAVHLANSLIFDDWVGVSWLLRGIGYVAAIAVFIEALLAVLGVDGFELNSDQPKAAAVAPAPERVHPAIQRLMEKLPEEKRGALVHLEAQGHYLRVVTEKGEEKLLMRLSDALTGLPIGLGVQTHRSHWVALDAADCLISQGGRSYVRMNSGNVVPISKARADAVRSIFEGCPEST